MQTPDVAQWAAATNQQLAFAAAASSSSCSAHRHHNKRVLVRDVFVARHVVADHRQQHRERANIHRQQRLERKLEHIREHVLADKVNFDQRVCQDLLGELQQPRAPVALDFITRCLGTRAAEDCLRLGRDDAAAVRKEPPDALKELHSLAAELLVDRRQDLCVTRT
uniref:Uncharacterized protein n=1 Tax=Globisporangium ultimum (strain ATCC 200006 / CBS 805.95 / DAOM BR144) TaxID=431595 RepID=K3WHG7_GLOUD